MNPSAESERLQNQDIHDHLETGEALPHRPE